MPEISSVPEWTMSYQGVRLGGRPYMVQSVSGLLDLPEVRSNDLEVIQRDGLWPGEDYLGQRSVSISVRCVGSSETDLSNQVAILRRAFRSSRGELPLYFCIPGVADGAPSKILGRSRKFEVELDRSYGHYNAEIDIQFDATSPYINPVEGLGIRRYFTGVRGSLLGGAYVPLVFEYDGLEFPPDISYERSTPVVCHNGSDTRVPMRFEIEGNIKGPRIVNDTTGKFVGFPNLILTMGQKLTVNPNSGETDWVVSLVQDSTSVTVPKAEWESGSGYWDLSLGVTQFSLTSSDESDEDYSARAVASWVPGRYV